MTTDQLATTLPAETADAMAARLFAAMREREPVAPLTDEAPTMTMADGYAVQQGFVRRLLDAGDGVVGYKLGLTSVAMQQLLGRRPAGLRAGPHVPREPRRRRDRHVGVHPAKMEAEIALVLGSPLSGPDCTADDVRAAVTGAVAALEIVDSRIADWRIKLPDTVADLASCGAIVLSGTVVPVDFDLRLVGMVFSRDGGIVATGAGAAALGDRRRPSRGW